MSKEFILIIHKGVSKAECQALLSKYNATMCEDYNGLERHFHIEMDETLKYKMRAESHVCHVAPGDAVVTFEATQTINVDNRGLGDNWGLSRIDQRNWNDSTWYPNSGTYNYFKTGKGVDAYVVDTGCRLSHSDFEGRASTIFDYYRSSNDPLYGIDQQGHGTHVASTIAGKKYGVAKGANILVSRVFDTGGATLTAVISGMNACLSHHKNKTNGNRSVMNLSLGGPAHIAEEQAVNDLIEAGVVICAAAGNDGMDLDAPNFDVMPAEIARAITVGSVDIQDRISSFSNYGFMVDVFAPGHFITAAGWEADDGELMISGTSMATPHVAGVCALYMESMTQNNTAAHVKEVHDWIRDNSTPNTLTLTEAATDAGTANRLLYSEYVTGTEPVPEPTPVTEVGRETEDVVSTVITYGDPVTVTTFEDVTISKVNEDGSTTTTVTRHYTDTTTVVVTTAVNTTPKTTITYSDGTTEIVWGTPYVKVTTEDKVTVETREEIISEETTPAPVPEPTPEPEPEPTPEPVPTRPGKRKGWWKAKRTWVKGRHRRRRLALSRLIRNLERHYESQYPGRHGDVEDLFEELETLAGAVANGKTGKERIRCFMLFADKMKEIHALMR